jgi:phenylpyruvate tautomerase PptA (4-oxalocrotonate tautomerase family)
MPRWLIQHSPNTLTPEEKSQLAQQITQVYVGVGLPAFYVQVHFTEQPAGTSFIGAEQHSNFVALTIHHLARTMTTDEQRQRFLNRIDSILTPMFEPKGIDWEYYVTEAPRDLWKINGLVPPATGSEEEKVWARENRAVRL